MITKTYKITGSRHDVAEYYIDEFTVTGKTTKSCDKEAIKRFKPHVFKKSNAWDDLTLRRIDVRPVIRDVASSARLRALREHKLPDDYDGLLPRDDD